jgi:hypothetical protein
MIFSRLFSKGQVDPRQVGEAMATQRWADAEPKFRSIGLTGKLKLFSPRAGYWQPPADLIAPRPAAIDSRQKAATMVEQALALVMADIPFRGIRPWLEANGNPLDGLADDLQGPTMPASVFRLRQQSSPTPFVSQLLLLPVQNGALHYEQRYIERTGWYGVTEATRAAIAAGSPSETQTYGEALYINNLRTLASAVHQDRTYSLGLQAAWILLSLGAKSSSLYPSLPAESGGVSYDGSTAMDGALAEAAELATRAGAHEKWALSQYPRPEELARYPEELHPIWQERGVPLLEQWNGFWPSLTREGCPMHSSYISNHAAIGWAVATTLKAWFADAPWPRDLVQASPDGRELITANGSATIHGELDKLGWNYSIGRLSIHDRVDYYGGAAVGQAAALRVLQRRRMESGEPWGTTTFIGWDGQPVTV